MSLIADRYQPLDGRRAGVPLRARDLQTAQTVLLHAVSLPSDPQAAERALSRALACQRIFHPALVTLFDVIPEAGTGLLLAYEYVPAQTLAQVGGGQPFNVRRAAEIVAEVADAAAELHARALAHGSISSSTVLLTMKGKAKLDRAGDPTLSLDREPGRGDDIRSLTGLLGELVGKPLPGTSGVQAIEKIIAQVRRGQIETAATLAACLRRIS